VLSGYANSSVEVVTLSSAVVIIGVVTLNSVVVIIPGSVGVVDPGNVSFTVPVRIKLRKIKTIL
jgi:hypothetical protein